MIDTVETPSYNDHCKIFKTDLLIWVLTISEATVGSMDPSPGWDSTVE